MAYRQERENYRKGSFKQSIDADDTKRRRAENQQTVRKNKRTEQLNKKRNFGPASQTPQVKLTVAELQNSIAKLPQYADDLRSEVYGRRFEAVFALRQLLSIEVDPPINQVANAGIIPLLVNILNNDPDAKIQFEAAWALTNVASGNSEQTALLIRQNAVQAFISKITHPSEITVKEQCVWALGNIAGDSHLCRDYILHEDVLQLLLKETGEEVKTSLRRNAVWTISNLCRGKPTPPFEKVAIAIPVLAELIKSADANVVTDACWALSYLSDGDNTRINTLLQHNVCETVVTLLNHNSSTVQTPALRVIGNIVTGDDIQTEAAIQCGCLPALKYMLDNNPKKSIKREVCWTLSNITAGTISQIQHVLNAGIAESLINHMKFAEFDVRKEAAWAIANATSSGNIHQIKSLVEKGCILPLCELVKAPDVRVVAVSLEGLENILERGEHLRPSREDGENPFVLVIEECGGLEHIERLATHPNPSIFNKAKDLLEKFFGLEDNDQNTAPNIASDGQAYNFSTNTDATGLSF